MANANYSHTERCALIVREDNVKHLAKAVSEYTGKDASVTLHFKDGFSFSSEDVDEVMAANRLRSTLVERIAISSRSDLVDGAWKAADVILRESVGSGMVSVDIRSNADDMAHLTSEIKRETGVMRPSYNLLHAGNPPMIYWAGMILGLIIGVWRIREQFFSVDAGDNDIKAFVAFAVYVLMYGVTGLTVAHILRTIAMVWMPPFIAAIGLGKSLADGKADGRKWALRLVLGAVALAVGGAILRSVWPARS